MQDSNLQDTVKFLGFVPDEQLPVAYQAADMTIVPSQALEGFGLIVLESLASGTPVTCTPVGGMPEILQGFSPDLIMRDTSVAAIAEKIEDVLTGRVEVPTAQACRDYAVENYDWK